MNESFSLGVIVGFFIVPLVLYLCWILFLIAVESVIYDNIKNKADNSDIRELKGLLKNQLKISQNLDSEIKNLKKRITSNVRRARKIS